MNNQIISIIYPKYGLQRKSHVLLIKTHHASADTLTQISGERSLRRPILKRKNQHTIQEKEHVNCSSVRRTRQHRGYLR